MDCAFFAIAFNIKKLSSKIAKQTKNGEIHPILDCINKYQHFYRLRIRFFGEKSSKIGRLKNIRTSVAKNQRLRHKKNHNYDTASSFISPLNQSSRSRNEKGSCGEGQSQCHICS